MMPFLFQMIGGRSVPWIAQVRTALRPTVTVETLIRWSSARLSCTTSVRMRVKREMIGVGEREWMPERQIKDDSKKKRFRKMRRCEKEGGKKMAEKITNQNSVLM